MRFATGGAIGCATLRGRAVRRVRGPSGPPPKAARAENTFAVSVDPRIVDGLMAVYALGDRVPDIHPDAYVHPDAVVIGDVRIAAGATIWPGAVLRGDYGTIRIGERT